MVSFDGYASVKFGRIVNTLFVGVMVHSHTSVEREIWEESEHLICGVWMYFIKIVRFERKKIYK